MCSGKLVFNKQICPACSRDTRLYFEPSTIMYAAVSETQRFSLRCLIFPIEEKGMRSLIHVSSAALFVPGELFHYAFRVSFYSAKLR